MFGLSGLYLMPKRNLNYNFSKGLKRANDYNVTPPVNQTLIIP